MRVGASSCRERAGGRGGSHGGGRPKRIVGGGDGEGHTVAKAIARGEWIIAAANGSLAGELLLANRSSAAAALANGSLTAKLPPENGSSTACASSSRLRRFASAAGV